MTAEIIDIRHRHRHMQREAISQGDQDVVAFLNRKLDQTAVDLRYAALLDLPPEERVVYLKRKIDRVSTLLRDLCLQYNLVMTTLSGDKPDNLA